MKGGEDKTRPTGEKPRRMMKGLGGEARGFS